MEFSLFYFANDSSEVDEGGRYQLLIEGARFADANGFAAVWTPERHFHPFGGLYPNPAVTGAAVAAVTSRVAIRAGSVVAPLHHPMRIAEDWSVVDNLSRRPGGRLLRLRLAPDGLRAAPGGARGPPRAAERDARVGAPGSGAAKLRRRGRQGPAGLAQGLSAGDAA